MLGVLTEPEAAALNLNPQRVTRIEAGDPVLSRWCLDATVEQTVNDIRRLAK